MTRLTLLLKNGEPITFSADSKSEVLSLLSQWMDQNDGLVRKPARCDGLSLVIGRDGDGEGDAVETITFEYIRFHGGTRTQYSISSGYTDCEPYEIERFLEDWLAARDSFLKLALEHGQWEE